MSNLVRVSWRRLEASSRTAASWSAGTNSSIPPPLPERDIMPFDRREGERERGREGGREGGREEREAME